ncbi:aminoglycoside phosphotransferase [Streptomyces sp. NPDC004111]|uniref:aminoglycoside phosphotransferase n=1 Tax=Streptomyces sp. NPDC004111 TaxID=3364690 RepID=UPI0036773DA5
MGARIGWADLPAGAAAAVHRQVGVPTKAVDAQHAAASGVAALLTAADGTTTFAKGQRDPAPAPAKAPAEGGSSWWGPSWSAVDELDLEEAVNPYLPASSPAVLWRVHADGWHLLGFEGLHGRDADFAPGSPDLDAVVGVLAELGRVRAPETVRLPTVWDRWGYYCDPADEPLFAGGQLLHTDPASTNVLISAPGRAHLVDWSWPATGPSWVDVALWGMRLISTGGHSPASAWQWAARVPGWTDVDPVAVQALVRAEGRRWRDLTDEVPSAAAIADAAHTWADSVGLQRQA